MEFPIHPSWYHDPICKKINGVYQYVGRTSKIFNEGVGDISVKYH